MFLTRAFQKLLAEKDIKKFPEVKKACDQAIAEINEEIERFGGDQASVKSENIGPNSIIPPPSKEDDFVDADRYFTPFRVACEAKSPALNKISLDFLQKLLAHGQMKGNTPLEGTSENTRLIDAIVDTICRCFVGDATDEGVQLQIIKALLTAVTAPTCEVHEASLLKAIRTCYNIYLASKNAINQTTAKATLTQMLNAVFQKMEAVSEVSLSEEGHDPNGVIKIAPSLPPHREGSDDDSGLKGMLTPRQGARLGVEATNGHESSTDRENSLPLHTASSSDHHGGSNEVPRDEEASTDPHDDANPDVGQSVSQEEEKQSQDENVPQAMLSPIGKYGFCIVCGKGANQWCGETKKPICSDACREEHRRHAEPVLDELDSRFGHICRKDAFLVFRSMCKLSMKDLSERDVVDMRGHELRSKVLSLELQLSMLQNAGKAFKTDPLFIDAIKQYLCVALSKNGVSHIPVVFELSIAIFLVLLQSFRTHLKMQIEVFFKEILLSMLELSTSSFQHKWMVVVCLSKICCDPQTLIDIYVNYDCDEFLTNIFGRLVNDLTRIAQGRSSSELGATPQQEQALKNKGLECLSSLSKCLVLWVKELNIDAEEGPTPTTVFAERHDVVPADPVLPARDGDGVSTGPVASPIDFTARKQKKEIREAGIELFNSKPVKGINFLMDQGVIPRDGPASVAQFLLQNDRLDKTAVGEYLGDHDAFCVSVMHAYTDALDFSKTPSFLDSLRLFLSGFRLPGEAQKIDRLMEKFAQRYCEVHKANGVFASADAAYVLAYSVIMLTTDLHSVKIKKKMTKDQFVHNNRGINDNKNLPREYLEDIFDAIEKEEIKMKGGNAPQSMKAESSDLHDPEKRWEHFNTFIQSTSQSVKEQLAYARASQSIFITATHYEHAKAIFEDCWGSLMAVFTVPFSLPQIESHVVTLCLEGIVSCIHIACVFGLTLERNTFCQSLVKFTNLGAGGELKHKNVEAIKALLDAALAQGNYLGECWRDVLLCISQLDQSALVLHAAHHPQVPKPKKETALEASSQVIVVAVDRIFARSKQLRGEPIVDFVRALCSVSMEELACSPPRMYGLTKMVEIAYYNMDRIRLEWAHIWAVMGDYFNKVGCVPSTDIACFAVDSLRQLSMKFLEKGELANYSFQKDFLRPFEYIMQNNKGVALRDMVVRCVAQMVQAKANNIKSGWKNIFFVFFLAASDTDQGIVDLAFESASTIFDLHISRVSSLYMDAINCIAEFACNPHFTEINMAAIKHLKYCATVVAEQPELFVFPGDELIEEPQIWVRGWFPVLFGLSRIVNRCRLQVRTRALTVLFEILKSSGHLFISQWWRDLFRVLFRIFDDKKLQSMGSDLDRTDWLTTTCNHALRSLAEILIQYFDLLQDVVFSEFLDLLSWSIRQPNEILARAGVVCLHNIIMVKGKAFKDSSWEGVCVLIKDVMQATSPQDLFSFEQELLASRQVSLNAPSNTSLPDDPDGAGGSTKIISRDSNQAEPREGTSDDTTMENTGDITDDDQNAHGSFMEPSTGEEEGESPNNNEGDVTNNSEAFDEETKSSELSSTVSPRSPPHASSQGPSSPVGPKNTPPRPHLPRVVSSASVSEDGSNEPPSIRSIQDVFNGIIIKCVVQLELIQLVENILLAADAAVDADANEQPLSPPKESSRELSFILRLLTPARIYMLLNSLIESHEFAKRFNLNLALRTHLWRLGFMKNKPKPNLLRQETSTMSCVLRVLCLLYASDRGEMHDEVEKLLLHIYGGALQHFTVEMPRETREFWYGLVCIMLRELLALPDHRFVLHATKHFAAITGILSIARESPLGEIAVYIAEFYMRTRGFDLLSSDSL